jgi:prepilin-type N-terminal cleavage/methylation domain-containing protein
VNTRLRAAPSGFTLVELLVVVAVLAVLAGVVLPKFDRVQLKANKAVAGSNIADTSRAVQSYRALHNRYPDGWDSLLDSTGALWVPGAPGTTPGLDPQLVGGPPTGSPTKLTTATFSGANEELRSLGRIGITTLYDLNGSTDIPGNRFTVTRTIAVGDKYATVNAADGDGKAIIDQVYPANKKTGGTSGAIPSGKHLLVVGIGPLNNIIGDILQECPTYANIDPSQYYNRNLAIFEFSEGGSRAELKAIVGADADRLEEEINDFFAP